MYAVLYCIHESIIEIQNRLEHNFSLFAEWLNENELIVNTKKGKTEIMVFGTSKRLNTQKHRNQRHTDL